jgi:hypothetical protein
MLKLGGRTAFTFEPTPYPLEPHQLSSSTGASRAERYIRRSRM